MLAAQQYYVDYGTDMDAKRLTEKLTQYLPKFVITVDKPVSYWHQLAMQAYNKVTQQCYLVRSNCLLLELLCQRKCSQFESQRGCC